MKHYRYILAAFLAAFCTLGAGAQDFQKIVNDVDEAYSFEDRDFTGVFTMVTDKPGEKQKVSQIRMFRRDGKDQFMILVLQPEADKGQGYMKEGDNLWFYDPVSRKFSHTSMKEALADSEAESEDFNDDDLLEDYAVQKGEEGMLGKFPVWIITLKGKTNEVSYDVIRLYVRKDRPLILKQENLSLSGRLMRTMLYPKYADVGNGKYFPSQMLIVDEINKGEKTQITMSELSTKSLPDKVFTKAFLEQAN